MATQIDTLELCQYGCGQVAQWQFKQGKLCCSKSYNSCPEKRRKFSEEIDHQVYSSKSLATRTRLGITRTAQVKASETRRQSGHYDRLAERMKDLWEERPWNNQCRSGFSYYKDTGLAYQGSYEFSFLERLEQVQSKTWISENVKRGPSLRYIDPETRIERVYLPDFLIGNTIYEIKSSWTWNQKESNQKLEILNQVKLLSAKEQGYQVILVLDHKEIEI